VYLQDSQGKTYYLRGEPNGVGEKRLASSEPYTMRFDGTAPTDDPQLIQRLLPDGEYTVFVRALATNGQEANGQQPLSIQAGDITPPLIENLVIYPETISPNADGIDDEAEITYQLPVTATIDISILSPDGAASYPFVTASEEEPQQHRHNWSGRTVDGLILPDGVYTYLMRARDIYGNIVERTGPIAIAGGGQPEARITYSKIAPEAVMRGDVITITMRVENTGDVPIRTYGPPSGYEYTTDDVFSSIEGGDYAVKSGGFWRIGVDWDANSGGAAKRYPFRWAISPRPPEQWKIPPGNDDLRSGEDVLLPGEQAEIIGRIRILQPETKMGFYNGLIQDGVGFFQDRNGRTIVEVGF
jgi:hypothetical protein